MIVCNSLFKSYIIIIIFIQIMKLFFDHSSQPSRAVLSFCLINKISFQLIEKRIIRGDHLTQEFKKIHPAQKFPVIVQEDNFVLAESHSILRYLARKYKTPQHWYPQRNLKKVARIDEYLDFHHTNTRNCAKLTFNKGFINYIGDRKNLFKIFGNTSNPNFQQLQMNVKNALTQIEQYSLGDTNYISNNQISIADLSAYCQIKQMDYIKYDLSPYKNIVNWMKRVQQIKQVTDAHAIFNKIVKLLHQKHQKHQHHQKHEKRQKHVKHTEKKQQ